MDFDEIELDRPPVAPGTEEPPDRFKWIVLATVVVVAGVIGYVAVRRPMQKPAASRASAVVPISKPATPTLEGEKIALPPLEETDPLVRDLVVKLSSHPRVLAWLATKGLIENFAITTLNVSEGRPPVKHLRALAPTARFRTRSAGSGVFLDPVSYHRYDEYASAVDGLDVIGTARLYLTLKPRILDAYRALGYPDGDFDPVLAKAIADLLAVPGIDHEIPVFQKTLSYVFVDPQLEALTPAQKLLLRMGPRNNGLVKQKLNQIAKALGLHLNETRARP